MIKYINSKGKRAGKLHRKKNASKIISKGFFAPKKQDKQQEKDISRRRVHAKKHGILREMFFLGDRIKKCHYPTAPLVLPSIQLFFDFSSIFFLCVFHMCLYRNRSLLFTGVIQDCLVLPP